jgi:hypothetical protein
MTSVEREHSVCELAADKWIGAGLRKRLREEGFARLTLVISRDCSRINERLARVFQLDYGAYMAVNGLLAVAVSGCLLISCGGSEAPRAPAAERKRAAPKKVLPAGPAPSTSRTVEKCDAACSGCTVLLAADATKRTPSRPLRDYERTTLDIYFRSHLLSHECTSDPQHLEVAAIGSVDDVSTVKEIVVGAFTAPGAKQTFISFFLGHCGLLGSHAEHYGTTVGLLFEQERLIASGTDGPTLAVELLAVDLDNDGVSELVERTADYASATTFSAATVWS